VKHDAKLVNDFDKCNVFIVKCMCNPYCSITPGLLVYVRNKECFVR